MVRLYSRLACDCPLTTTATAPRSDDQVVSGADEDAEDDEDMDEDENPSGADGGAAGVAHPAGAERGATGGPAVGTSVRLRSFDVFAYCNQS